MHSAFRTAKCEEGGPSGSMSSPNGARRWFGRARRPYWRLRSLRLDVLTGRTQQTKPLGVNAGTGAHHLGRLLA